MSQGSTGMPPTDSGANIKVVVRCRPTTKQEEGRKVVVKAAEDMEERQVTVKSKPSKTYTFDRVFGTDSNQEMIYDEVVNPILSEVLQGYNCTIFAYGQTGTGKTYTMAGGDPHQGHGNTLIPSSGIIPRALHHLFQRLETEYTDYNARVSYTELYNEEIKDLLDKSKRQLRISEDARGKGVVIEGLSETPVHDASEAVGLLNRGSRDRIVAATLCNEFSSRSHAIFSITIMCKEGSIGGEDVVKVGKLHLVDLAGSESIGRSGAQNEQAREAGKINTSLLTLGRVINALEEKKAHVPYRESKLTHILKDSLGGKTKTCLIATISPVEDNLKETLSTLDYVYRAKSIRNRPQINQLISRRMLLQENAQKIARLTADLEAARSKNGYYLAEGTYRRLEQEREELQERHEALWSAHMEIKKRHEDQETSMRDAHRILRRMHDSLMKNTGGEDLGRAEERSFTDEAPGDSEGGEEEVGQVKGLMSIVRGLAHILQDRLRDTEKLHDKMDRMSRVEDENLGVLKAFEGMVREETEGWTRVISGHASALRQANDDANQAILALEKGRRLRENREQRILQQVVSLGEEAASGRARGEEAIQGLISLSREIQQQRQQRRPLGTGKVDEEEERREEEKEEEEEGPLRGVVQETKRVEEAVGRATKAQARLCQSMEEVASRLANLVNEGQGRFREGTQRLDAAMSRLKEQEKERVRLLEERVAEMAKSLERKREGMKTELCQMMENACEEVYTSFTGLLREAHIHAHEADNEARRAVQQSTRMMEASLGQEEGNPRNEGTGTSIEILQRLRQCIHEGGGGPTGGEGVLGEVGKRLADLKKEVTGATQDQRRHCRELEEHQRRWDEEIKGWERVQALSSQGMRALKEDGGSSRARMGGKEIDGEGEDELEGEEGRVMRRVRGVTNRMGQVAMSLTQHASQGTNRLVERLEQGRDNGFLRISPTGETPERLPPVALGTPRWLRPLPKLRLRTDEDGGGDKEEEAEEEEEEGKERVGGREMEAKETDEPSTLMSSIKKESKVQSKESISLETKGRREIHRGSQMETGQNGRVPAALVQDRPIPTSILPMPTRPRIPLTREGGGKRSSGVERGRSSVAREKGRASRVMGIGKGRPRPMTPSSENQESHELRGIRPSKGSMRGGSMERSSIPVPARQTKRPAMSSAINETKAGSTEGATGSGEGKRLRR